MLRGPLMGAGNILCPALEGAFWCEVGARERRRHPFHASLDRRRTPHRTPQSTTASDFAEHFLPAPSVCAGVPVSLRTQRASRAMDGTPVSSSRPFITAARGTLGDVSSQQPIEAPLETGSTYHGQTFASEARPPKTGVSKASKIGKARDGV